MASTAHQYASAPSFAQLHGNARAWGVFYIWGHAFEFHDRNHWAGIERIFKPLSGHADTPAGKLVQLV